MEFLSPVKGQITSVQSNQSLSFRPEDPLATHRVPFKDSDQTVLPGSESLMGAHANISPLYSRNP